MYELPETLGRDIENLGTLTDKFIKGEIGTAEFKVGRVPMGIYEQRKDGVYMVRIRTTGGIITPGQLIEIINIAKRHGSDLLHITTRQEIQIQNISIESTGAILRELKKIGLSSKGGGGNTVRNILVATTSVITDIESFDPTPHAEAITTKLIAETDSFTLPRKLKIAFSNNEDDTDFAAINDIGFIAKIKNGQRGFKLYVGGSVASKPTVGWVFADFIPEEDIFAVAGAVKKLFSEHGNRKNKHKARIRHIFYRLGAEEVKRLFDEYFKEEKKTAPKFVPDRYIEKINPSCNGNISSEPVDKDFLTWKNRYATAQKQYGLYSVVVPFIHGNINIGDERFLTQFQIFLRFLEFIGDDTVRFSVQQNIILRNIPESFLFQTYSHIHSINPEIKYPLLTNNIVSCTGADTCRLGICLSKGLAAAIRRKLINEGAGLDNIPEVRLQISGCPNSCGQQVWADLGFSGKALRNSRLYPAYQVYAGASRGKSPALAETLGSLNAHDVPEFTQKVLEDFSEKKEKYGNFKNYLESEGRSFIKGYLDAHKEIPDFSEDKNYYYDWGSENLFSVAERGVGECSAGIFDMIDIDKATIEKLEKQLAEAEDDGSKGRILRSIVFHASRMLLVTRGAEPNSEEETFELFRKLFIDEGLVDNGFINIIEQAKAGNTDSLITSREKVIELSNDIDELYKNMDDSLQFKNVVKENNNPVEKKTIEPASAFKYLRGVACPMNFVQTKIMLSGMKPDQLLEILLDDGQPIANVPGSVRNEGHEVLSQEMHDGYWKVLIKKK
ncbi:MAG: sulfurtransferase TusA family protein [Rikenellaceae bacterium]|nr:sulfurtransferase TusA family protein [Rikenellaceae bacterium]